MFSFLRCFATQDQRYGFENGVWSLTTQGMVVRNSESERGASEREAKQLHGNTNRSETTHVHAKRLRTCKVTIHTFSFFLFLLSFAWQKTSGIYVCVFGENIACSILEKLGYLLVLFIGANGFGTGFCL